MRPLDPRLLRHARASRTHIAVTAVFGVGTTAVVVVQALLLAQVIVAGFSRAARPGEVAGPIAALSAAVLVRAGLMAAQERLAHRAAVRVIAQLRAAVLARLTRSPDLAAGRDAAAEATLLTRGLDGLEGYLTKYLPQLLLAATLTPGLLVVILWQDPWSALAMAITLPLIPAFMALIGWSTQSLAARRLVSMQRLGAQVLDLITGLPTLHALGRARAQALRVREVGEAYRRATMSTLRLAFTSSLVLESFATLSVALVAVGIGLRLVSGRMDLETGLAVLILAPEVYLPLRLVGVHYHAAADGVAAAEQALGILDGPVPAAASPAGRLRSGRLPAGPVSVHGRGISVQRRGRRAPDGLSLDLYPGEVVALIGPNGSGKSTAVEVLLGLRAPEEGRVLLRAHDGSRPHRAGDGELEPAAVDLADVDPQAWHQRLAWVPQRPVVLPDTLEANLWFDGPRDQRDRAAALTGLDAVVTTLPEGWQTRVGHGGHGLSAGQRQLLGLTRAVLRQDAELVILDEPTAHLDVVTERSVLRLIGYWRERGAAVLVIAHRPTLAAQADRAVEVGARLEPSLT
ncbi:MAG: thiol reductant ABC exporter subunit CydD [Kineosporiaceae bacterium]|nr:thiol reductant ABC exporter subunit CydD [Kineosporiaceae bacterium]